MEKCIYEIRYRLASHRITNIQRTFHLTLKHNIYVVNIFRLCTLTWGSQENQWAYACVREWCRWVRLMMCINAELVLPIICPNYIWRKIVALKRAINIIAGTRDMEMKAKDLATVTNSYRQRTPLTDCLHLILIFAFRMHATTFHIYKNLPLRWKSFLPPILLWMAYAFFTGFSFFCVLVQVRVNECVCVCFVWRTYNLSQMWYGK